MKKETALLFGVFFSFVWFVFATFEKDKVKKEACFTRSFIFAAAILIILALPD